MTPEREARIRSFVATILHNQQPLAESHCNEEVLLAEIDRLRAENDDMRNTRAVLRALRAEEERDQLKAEAKERNKWINAQAALMRSISEEQNQLREKLETAIGALTFISDRCSLASDPRAWPMAYTALKVINEN